jgi:phenylacetate-CoA ligase
MNIYNSLAENVFLPFGDILLGTSVSDKLPFLKKSQWWSYQKLEEFQNEKLRELIKHAYNNVPYYHNLFKSLNLIPEDIRSIGDLNKLPIITKEEIRKNISDFIAVNVPQKDLIRRTTSGSSGHPFEYIIDKNVLSIFRSMTLRTWEVAGYNLGDKIATVSGSSLLPKKMTFLQKVSFKVNRNLPLSSFNMNSEKVQSYCNQLLDFNPKFLRGYPSSIFILANYVVENNIKLNLSAVMTTAETLLPTQREIIMDAFNCDVFDLCGCNDGGECLFECKEHVGYHIGCERSIHEFINENGENSSNKEIGNIILTDLWNYSMPLIRYDAGDMAVYTDEKCSCGRELPLVKSIMGRSIEQIILPDGNTLPGLTFTDIFEKEGVFEYVLDYQIVQEKINKFHINMVITDKYNAQISNKIQRFFEEHMGIPLDINFNFVDQISRTNANKRKLIISKVNL